MLKTAVEESLRGLLQQCGLKVTRQRVLIFRELNKAKDHPNAELILKRVRKALPTVSFDTVNRTLLTFAEVGLASIIEGKGDPKRFDPDIDGHHHFRCRTCGKIFDFCNQDFYESLQLPEIQRRGFVVHSKRLVLEGSCNICETNDNS